VNSQQSIDWRPLIAPLALWFAISLASILLHGPMPLYSTRTLGVAWEMWQRGDLLVPHLNGESYSHKAPMLYWLIHLGWAVGGVGDIWPRLLMVLISTALIAATARLAARLYPQRTWTASQSPWLLAGSMFLFLYALQIMFDVLLALWVVLALLAIAPAGRRDRPHFALAGLAIGAGLLTKGPVMLLHVAFPLLLGPWWHPGAWSERWRWYRGVLGALALGLLVFGCWLVPAVWMGDPQYREELLFQQTQGRVVDAFDHARPVWWYLAALPVLWFPWLLWWPMWQRFPWRPMLGATGDRLLAAWIWPTFAAFCLISAKQAYYLVPLYPALAIGMARLFDGDRDNGRRDRERSPRLLWPFALGWIAAGVAWLAVPSLVAAGRIGNRWLAEAGQASPVYPLAWIALGLLLFRPTRNAGPRLIPRLATTTLLALALGHAAFTDTLWRYFDLKPVAEVIARAQRDGQPVATSYTYEGEYQFLGRLTEPLVELADPDVAAWAAAHPDGLLVTRPGRHVPRPDAHPRFETEFRQRRIQIWRAGDWLAVEAPPPPPPPVAEPQAPQAPAAGPEADSP